MDITTNKAYLGDVLVYEKTSDNLVLNSTFDDSSNLSLESAWSVAGGVLFFDNSKTSRFTAYLSQIISSGETVEVTFDVLNGGGDANFEILMRDSSTGANETYVSFADYPDGTGQTVQFQLVGDRDQLRFRASATNGGSFSFDNITLRIL